MTNQEQREAARQFYNKWRTKGQEDQDDRSYWIELLQILGVERPTDYIEFQKRVIVDGNTKRMDCYIPETKIVIEQKSRGVELDKPQLQSGGIYLTPYQQAKRYYDNLLSSERGRWIVTSNFAEIWIYDLDKKEPEKHPEKLQLRNLMDQITRLDFIRKKEAENISEEERVSMKAGDIVGMLYDAFRKEYAEPDSKESSHSLNVLCTRIVFCLYAEDAGLFDTKTAFHDYMTRAAEKGLDDAREALVKLFRVLNQSEGQRSRYLPAELAAFPYVNGGLFAAEIEIPWFTEEIVNVLEYASADFDWSKISPTIFGAVFESTLNPETRRAGGMHYTSIENIHKVIDPLFLDDLTDELNNILYENAKTQAEIRAEQKARAADYAKEEEKIRDAGAGVKASQRHLSAVEGAYTRKRNQTLKQKVEALNRFQEKMAGLTFLDPACGSGNFLTETYLSLRRLENVVIREKMDALAEQSESGSMSGQMSLFDKEQANPIMMSIAQFYGIEINDFAVTVAKTALWIAEHQTIKETEDIMHMSIDFLPLKTAAGVINANALRIDWNTIIPKQALHYIMGNPPFVGKKYQTAEQKADMKEIFGAKAKGVGSLDYVTAWYRKAIEYMQSTDIMAAFVSTNSVVQGEHVPLFWKVAYEQFSVNIIFAHRTFKWNSEASEKAAVHCVIIGFCARKQAKQPWIYVDGTGSPAHNIHPYLIDMPNVFIENRSKPLCECKPLVYGSFALDDGNYTISEAEYKELIAREPEIAKYFRLFIGSEEFINGKKRYCIWLKDADAREIRKSHILSERVKNVQEWRSKSKRKETVAAANTPMLFAEIRQPETDYMAIPITSSENRRYIPIGYMTKDIIASNHLLVLPDATLFDFGVLMSNVHMSWMRVVAGRLKSDYNYSARIVYNNFPWCMATDDQKAEVAKTAQGIINARKMYPDYTLAELYDRVFMPQELRTAHDKNNKAVMQAYGFPVNIPEEECVARLMRLYQELTDSKQ